MEIAREACVAGCQESRESTGELLQESGFADAMIEGEASAPRESRQLGGFAGAGVLGDQAETGGR
jgi:hypothetical protein